MAQSHIFWPDQERCWAQEAARKLFLDHKCSPAVRVFFEGHLESSLDMHAGT